MSKCKILFWAIIIYCLLLFSGCNQEVEESPIEITLVHGWGGTLKTHDTMQQIYDEFSKRNPDIILKCTPYSDSSIAVDKANDMLAVDKMPDIVNTNGLSYYVTNTVKRNKVMDLIPYIKTDSELERQIHPSVYETWTTEDGKLYTVPDVLEVAGYWYNESYLEQAGITELPTTWEDFLEMTRIISEYFQENDEIFVCSLDQTQISEYLFLARLAGEGENGRNAAEDASIYLEKETIENTMNDIVELCSYSQIVDNIENARQQFIDGNSVLYFNGVWESDALMDSQWKDTFKYAAYPSSEGTTLTYVSPSSGYVFAKQSDERKAEACIRFLKYMLSEDVQMKIAVKTGQAPSNPRINLEQLEEGTPMFGNAIRISYDADIQIKTIWSVWPENKLQIVKNYSTKAQSQWESEDSIHMLQELNQAI